MSTAAHSIPQDPLPDSPQPGGMAAFAQLVVLLGTSTKTNDKLEALSTYFTLAGDQDKAWVIALFTGRKPKRTVNSTQLQEWCRALTGLPQWLFEESYHTVGDLAETIALLLPDPHPNAPSSPASPTGVTPQPGISPLPGADPKAPSSPAYQPIAQPSPASLTGAPPQPNPQTSQNAGPSLSWYLDKLISIGPQPEDIKKDFILQSWQQMNREERFVFNKLITGGFRIGISQKMIVNALAKTTGTAASVIAHRISGSWDPATVDLAALLSETGAGADISRPYPFYLAYALEDPTASLGPPEDWQAEWKWDGIRGQLIKRDGQLFVWSRGEELMTEKFPEYQAFKDLLPEGAVIDGEIICLDPNEPNHPIAPHAPGAQIFRPLPFAVLQTRIGRKTITKRQLSDAPVGFIAYDLLEYEGQDWRSSPLTERRARLEAILTQASHPLLQLSPIIPFEHWEALADARQQSRDRGSEGIMLKKKTSVYQVGRKRGDWWKWKIEPLVIDAVMIYAQKGHGRRSNLYTDYTFAVKDGDKLVTFTKAYSGLTDKELAEVDSFVKRNSLEKFGPVRTVKPELVFEIAFEGIAASQRHKSGVALRFPRINRWRKDKKSDQINTLEDLQQMLALYGKTS